LNQREVVSDLVGNIMADMLSRRTSERLREIASGGAYHSAPVEQQVELAPEIESESEGAAVAVENPTVTALEAPVESVEPPVSSEPAESEPSVEAPKKSKKRSKSKVEE
jgi:hypothetical protein